MKTKEQEQADVVKFRRVCYGSAAVDVALLFGWFYVCDLQCWWRRPTLIVLGAAIGWYAFVAVVSAMASLASAYNVGRME